MYIYDDALSARLIKKIDKTNVLMWSQRLPMINMAIIKKALDFCMEHHAGRLRDDGKPCSYHAICIAEIVLDFRYNTDIAVIAILHDIIDNVPGMTKETVQEMFGPYIADSVDGLSRYKKDEQTNYLASLHDLCSRNLAEAVYVKLADRIYDLQIMGNKPIEKQLEVIQETVEKIIPYLMGSNLPFVDQSFLNLFYSVIAKARLQICAHQYPALQLNTVELYAPAYKLST